MIKNITFSGICDLISQPADTLVFFHVRPDGDAVGSAFGLRLLLESSGSRAFCVCENEIPRRLRFLTDGIQDSVLPSSIPADFSNARIIAVDSGSASQLGGLFERYGTSVSIDHHGTSQCFCDSFTDSTAAATGEIIYDIACELARRGSVSALPRRFYECVYAAISSDTGCFRFSNTTPETHRRAAELLGSGIDAADINHKLFDSKTISELNAEHIAIEHLTTFHEGRISVVALDKNEILRLNPDRESFDVFINVARSLIGSDVAVSVRCVPEDFGCRVSMRSSGDVDVSKVCATFGGGGHVRAAGCTLETDDINEAIKLIITETERQML